MSDSVIEEHMDIEHEAGDGGLSGGDSRSLRELVRVASMGLVLRFAKDRKYII